MSADVQEEEHCYKVALPATDAPMTVGRLTDLLLRERAAARAGLEVELEAARECCAQYSKRAFSAEERLLPCYQRKSELLTQLTDLRDVAACFLSIAGRYTPSIKQTLGYKNLEAELAKQQQQSTATPGEQEPSP